jgi:hypothetical protein
MADTINLVQGSTTLDLDDTTNYESKTLRLVTPPDKELWFSPDFGESQLVRNEPAEREAMLVLRVKGTTEDIVQNNIVTLRRWFDEAKRHARDGDNDAVYLKLQKNSATNATRHLIKSCNVDDSNSHWIPERNNVSQALDVVLTFILAPFGEWDSTITLQNDMFSSPHFVEDSDADGLADGWAEVGSPATTINTTQWLVGGKSQKVLTDNTNAEGIVSDTVTAAQSSNLVAYCWIYIKTGGDDVTVRLRDGSDNNIESKTLAIGDTGSVSDKSLVDSNGKTWYRIVVSGSNTVAANAKLLISRAAGDATVATTFSVDACYLEVDQTTAPDAWASSKNIDNRNDILSTSQTTENYLNYIDTWGIPGDAPALALWKFTTSTGATSIRQLYAARVADGVYTIADHDHYVGSDEFTTAPAGPWSTNTGTTENQYQIFTAASTPDTGTATLTLTGDDARKLASSDLRAFAVCRAITSTSDTISLSATINGLDYADANAVSVPATSPTDWYLLDLGKIAATGIIPATTPASPSLAITLTVTGATTSNVFHIDHLWLLPIAHEWLISQFQNNVPTAGSIWIDGPGRGIITSVGGVVESGTLPSFWQQEPGAIANRNIFVVTQANAKNTYADELAASIVITPRTRYLMGT